MANRQTQVGPKPRRNKKSKSPNRRPNACRVKYGILIPNTIAQALDYDKCNGNTKWDDAMFDEMQTPSGSIFQPTSDTRAYQVVW